MRTYVTPTQPETVDQQAIRTILTGLSRRWRDVLSDSQRAAWKAWAVDHPITNRLGVKVVPTSLGAYVGLGSVCAMVNGNDITAAVSDPPFSEVAPETPVSIDGLQDLGGGVTRVFINVSTALPSSSWRFEGRMTFIGAAQVSLPFKEIRLIAGVGADSFVYKNDAGSLDVDYTPTVAAVTGQRYALAARVVSPSGVASLPVLRNLACS